MRSWGHSSGKMHQDGPVSTGERRGNGNRSGALGCGLVKAPGRGDPEEAGTTWREGGAAAAAYRPRACGRPRASSPRPARDLPWNSKWPMLWPWASRAAALLKLPRRVLAWPPCGHQQLHVRASASSRRPPMPAARSLARLATAWGLQPTSAAESGAGSRGREPESDSQ